MGTQQNVVLEELQEATARASNLEFQGSQGSAPVAPSISSSRPFHNSKNRKESFQSDTFSDSVFKAPTGLPPKPISSNKLESQKNLAPPFQVQNQSTVPSINHSKQNPSFINPLTLNPFIASQSMFPNPESYQEYLRVQEEQIKVARDHFKLQLSLGNRSPLGALMNGPPTQDAHADHFHFASQPSQS